MRSLRFSALAVPFAYPLSLSLALLLSACGGGGASSNDSVAVVPPVTPTGPAALVPSFTVAYRCEAPRSGSSIDMQGTLLDEKTWVRSWIDETYLWYREVPSTYQPQSFATPIAYFDVLKTTATTASGKPKDQFHFSLPTAEWEAAQNGVELGYGMLLAVTRKAPPRQAVVSIVEPGSPAALMGLQRGDLLQTIDGVDFIYAADTASMNIINAGLFPKAQGTHTLGLSRNGTPISVSLTAVEVSTSAVQNERIIDTPTGKVGYLTFNTHNNVAERQLVETMRRFQAAGISDLVLDVRYNGGGYLDIASELAYMIAGPQATTGKTFEQLLFNDKTKPQAPVPFHTQSLGFPAPNRLAQGTPLPSLGLKRVTLLTTSNTCSASEAIINGLRGVDVQVNLIGGTTCGKPYGFYPAANCGTTYFAVQFQGVNAKGFGDFADGIAPTCDVTDDYQHQLGDPAEGMLAAALRYRSSGSCVPATGATRLSSAIESPFDTATRLLRPAYKEIAILRR